VIRARQLAAAIALAAAGHAAAAPEPSTLLADLPLEVEQALAGADVDGLEPGAKLEAVFEASVPFRFEAGPLSVLTDPRWFQTLSPAGERGPLLELRRWPGDTVLALWAMEPRDPAAGPPVPGFDGNRVAGEGAREWRGTLATEAGPRPAVWIERGAGEAGVVGALILPGDAGFGDGAVDDLAIEARTVLGRLAADPARWRSTPVLAAGDEVVLPELSAPPGTGRVLDAPWQAVVGPGFTMGLPPGTRARSASQGVAAPRPVPDQLLWLRGRYVDEEGTLVQIGDGRRAGYVAGRAPGPDRGAAARPPAGAPSATRSAVQPFALAVERTGATEATVEHWDEPGFAGRWLVVRLGVDAREIEIGLPVVAGWRSPSLYWIPITWRRSTEAPALPPVDSGERFGIEFSRLTKLQHVERPWIEGFLEVPGLRAELPRGWSPLAAVRSADGFPVRFIDEGGGELGALDKMSAERIATIVTGEEWRETERAGGKHVARVWVRDADGAHVFASKRGDGFLLEPREGTDRDLWGRLLRSVRLTRPGR
jgi:hypothetical protein